MFKSLFFRRLYLPFLLIVFAVAVAVGLIGANRLHHAHIEQARGLLRNTVLVVAELLRPELEAGDIRPLRAEVASLASQLGDRITVIAPDGKVLADSEADPDQMSSHRVRPEILLAFSRGEGWDIRASETIHLSMLYYATRVELDGQIYYIRLAIHLTNLQASLRSLYLNIAFATGLCMLLAAIVAYYIARRQILPIVEVTEFADAVANGRLHHRILRTDPGELGVLARSLNFMADSFTRLLGDAEKDKSEMRAILSSMSEGIIAMDDSRRILLVNESAGRLLEFDLTSTTGKAAWEVIRQEPIIRAIDEVFTSQQRKQFILPAAAGLQLELTLCLFPHAGAGTASSGLIVVIHDVTQAMRYQELRKEFVANVSHELRTPLSVIKGYVETLRDGAADDPARREQYLATIDRHTQQLTNLVGDLLEISKLESQASAPRRSAVDLCSLSRRVASLLEPALSAKGHQLQVNLPPQSPPVLGNIDYLERALINLLDNAIKYTPANGQIRIDVRADATNAAIEVTDNGIGIPADDIPRIFERFYRVDRSRSREMGGTGLGLAIVKHIVQTHSGRVEVISQLNGGTTFRILIPLAQRI